MTGKIYKDVPSVANTTSFWEELNGRVLELSVGVDGDWLTVLGYEEETGMHYVLHHEQVVV